MTTNSEKMLRNQKLIIHLQVIIHDMHIQFTKTKFDKMDNSQLINVN